MKLPQKETAVIMGMRMMNKEKKRTPFNVKIFYRRTCLIIYDVISVILASYVALLMRYNFDF